MIWRSFSTNLETIGPFLWECTFVATALLMVAATAALVLRRQTAALRHRLWGLALVGTLLGPLVLPFLPELGPEWRLFSIAPRAADSSSAEAETAQVMPARVSDAILSADVRRAAALDKDAMGRSARPHPDVSQGDPPRTGPVGPAGGVAGGNTADSNEGWRLTPSVSGGSVGVWLFGAILGLASVIRGVLAGRFAVRGGVPITAPHVVEPCERLAAALGVTASVRVMCSRDTSVPLTIGVLRPTVVLPAGFGKWSDERLRVVLAHELAHVVRRDVLWQMLAAVARACYWFHPLVWIAAWRMRILREFACDDAVLEIGERPERYASHLVDVAAELAGTRESAPCAAVAMASRSTVEERIRALLAAGRRRGRVGRRAGVLLAVASVFLFLAVALLCPGSRSHAGVVEVMEEEDKPAAASRDDSTVETGTTEESAKQSSEGETAAAKRPEEGLVLVKGIVRDEAGKPIEGARVYGRSYPSEHEAVTGPDGRFALPVPAKRLDGLRIIARFDNGRMQATHQFPYEPIDPDSLQPVELKLGPTVVVQVQVTGAGGRPVEGAVAGVLAEYVRYAEGRTDATGRAALRVPADKQIHAVYAFKSGEGLDYRSFYDPQKFRNGKPQDEVNLDEPISLALTGVRPIRVRVLDAETEEPIPDLRVYLWLLKKPGEPDDLNLSFFTDSAAVHTDEYGVALFDWIPTWDERSGLTFWPSSEEYVDHRGSYKYETGDGTLTMKLHRLVPLRGRVRLPDGRPAAGIRVVADGEGRSHAHFRRDVTTDRDGRYEFLAAPNLIYLVVVDDEQWGAEPQTGFALWPGQPRDGIDFELRPTTRIYGHVTLGDERKPVSGQYISIYQYGKGLHELDHIELPNPNDETWVVRPIVTRNMNTDAEGRYEFFLGPGNYDIRGPTQNEVRKFEISQEESIEVNFHAARPEKGRLRGRVVVAGFDTPVPDASVYGIYRHGLAGRDIETQTDSNGEFDVERELHRTVLHARTDDGTLAGVIEIGPDDEEVTIQLRPLVTATGRLIDGGTREPLGGREIVYGVHVHIGDDDAPWRTSFGGKIHTDGEGRFTLDGLILDQPYDISVTNVDSSGWRSVGEVRPDAAGEIELGDLVLKPRNEPTLSDRVAAAFNTPEPLADRYEETLHDARLGRLRVLLVFADPADPLTEQFYHLRYENRDVFDALNEYRLLPVSLASDRAEEAAALARQIGISIDDGESPLLVILSSEGELRGRSDVAEWSGLSPDELVVLNDLLERELATYDGFRPDELLKILRAHALPPLDARQVLASALNKAKRENKRIILQETATWCGPCWRLSRFLDRHSDIISRDYLHVKMDHRWENWREVVTGLRDNKPRGIPWTAILDADGRVLATSDGPSGNIGFPSSPESIDHFLTMLRASSIRLTDDDLAVLKQALEAE